MFKNYPNTYEWLKDNIIIKDEDEPETIIIKDGRILTHVGGFSSCGRCLEIYKDDNNYCAHEGEFGYWSETEPPMFGYFDINLSWDELLLQIANKYDFRNNMLLN
jgi:hypothetical protein